MLKVGLPTSVIIATTTIAIAITATATATATAITTAASATITTAAATAAAVSATTATAAAITTAATTTTTTAALLGTTLFSLVHAKVTTLKVESVHFFDCLAGKVVISQGDESKSAWAVCLTIKGDEEVFDGSVSCECFTNVLI